MWVLPKGTPNGEEPIEECAMREVREETGLDVRIVRPIGEIEYWFALPRRRVHKIVHFFLMEALNRIGAVRTSIISAMEPLAAAVLGFIFLDESVTIGVAAGGLLILAGSVLASLARTPTAQEQQIP